MDVFQFAGPLQKLLVVGLILAMAAAVVVLIIKLSEGRRLSGGSAFLSGLRLGGPIMGGLGAFWSLLNMTLGYASIPGDPPLRIIAPGIAEAFLLICLGFAAGAVAVLAHWAVESRIDRSILKA
jgi:biopolymer transport protein ExbB/TolQ